MTATDSWTPALTATQGFHILVNRPNLQLDFISLTLDGARLRVTGDPGPDLTFQRSTNLFGWGDLLTSNSPALPFEWTDAGATNSSQTFYRLLLGP